MGNRASRVAPIRTLHIIDSGTRARYQNQRELVQLRVKLQNIQVKKNDALSRLDFNRHEVKTKLHELKHEDEQRQFFKKLNKRNPEDSSSFINESKFTDDSSVSTLENPSLLVHNLNSLNEWEKSLIFPIKSLKKNPVNAFETFQSKYKSKFDTSNRNPFKPTQSLLVVDDKIPLRKHTEQMKKNIKIAVVRAARDSHVIARREAHVF